MALLATLAGVVASLLIFQRQMIYHPVREDEAALLELARATGMRPWLGADGKIIGWFRCPGEPACRMLVLGGNAGHALHRQMLVNILEQAAGGRAAVYVLEYPGYGARKGKPSERSLVAAAVEAGGLLREGFPGCLVFVGESLGTGVACAAAAKMRSPPDALVLITPFDSLVSVGRAIYPWLPVGWILRDRYDSAASIASYPGRAVFLLAEEDEIVPPHLGDRLALAFPGEQKKIVVPGSDHNGIVGLLPLDQWREAIGFACGRAPHPPSSRPQL